MARKSMEWRGDRQVEQNMREYANTVLRAVTMVARYWQGVFESYAKQNAPWTDQTANARQSLHAWVEEVPAKMQVELYLSHGVEYGIFLETRFSGRYAIIWPTIRTHLEQIKQMLQGIFR